MQTKHTPGLWRALPRQFDNIAIYANGGDDLIAHVYNEEDARLIVAAPDMVEALERTLNWLASYQANAAMADNGPYWQARNALRKARDE